MEKNKYGSVFMYSSFQFSGNTEEYFAKHSRKFVAFIVLPRLNNPGNVIRVYKHGELTMEKKVPSSENIFLYYTLWYFQYLWIITRCFSRHEKIFVVSGHPISFLGMKIQKIFRKIIFVYWVCDYFPPVSLINKVYMRVSYHYHDRLQYRLYLSDRLNKKMNGKIIQTNKIKTVMWGVKESMSRKNSHKKSITLCFIGVIRPSQGLEETLRVIKELPFVKLKIIGSCDQSLYNTIHKKIRNYKISQRVFFPNKFYYGDDLRAQIADASVGVALYDVGPEHGTYYADPAKIKTYTEYGLPILMTDAAEIAQYIRRFSAGEVVERNVEDIKNAIHKLQRNYEQYLNGIKKFNAYFAFDKYYSKKFSFLEKYEK